MVPWCLRPPARQLGPCLWSRALSPGVGALGGVRLSYLCLPEHVVEPGVASDRCWQFTGWARLQAGGPSGGLHRRWRTATVGLGQKVEAVAAVSGRGPQEVRP